MKALRNPLSCTRINETTIFFKGINNNPHWKLGVLVWCMQQHTPTYLIGKRVGEIKV